MMKVALIYMVILVVCPAHLFAQDGQTYSMEKMDSILNPPLYKGGETILYFPSVRKDIGTMYEDGSISVVSFAYTNKSNATIKITRVVTSCGCTASQFNEKMILPGEKDTLSLTYNPKNHPGTIDVDAFVYSNLSDKSPIARLSLQGNVLPEKDVWGRFPYTIGDLKLKSLQLNFLDLTSSSFATERILCGNSGTIALQPAAIRLPDYIELHTEPAIIQPGEQADIVVTVDGSKIPANEKNETTLSIALVGINSQQSAPQLHATIKLIKKY